MILSDALILPVSQLQIQQVVTSQIRSHRIFNRLIILMLILNCLFSVLVTRSVHRLFDCVLEKRMLQQ